MRILLVEDDINIGQVIHDELLPIYNVKWKVTAHQGLYQAEVFTYDLVILDIGLPDLDGITTCALMRERAINIPILILTAHDEIGQKVAAFNSGADDYLTKPFEFEELLARIKALLRRPTPLVPEILEWKELMLNTSSRTAYLAGKGLSLRRKEFDLLAYFMRHPGQVLTRAMIVDHIWGDETERLSNVIDVNIKYLRNQMESNGQDRLIHTVPGLGYKLE